MWHCVLLLQEMMGLICASKISESAIVYLQIIIEEYFSDRCELVPDVPLQPKHHYISHYPELIVQFGSLLWVWTMRFERKHRYFKQCINSMHNFRNITQTLSEKHQRLQAYLSAGQLF